jgi:hypothetical protein
VFCARCGEQIPDASETCPLCGREASIHIDPPAPLPPVAYPRATAQILPAVIGPSGVRGWLLFYCIFLTILGPLVAVMELPDDRSLLTNYIFEHFSMLYGMVVGGVLWMQRPIGLLLLRIYYMIAGVFVLLRILNAALAAMRTHQSIFLMPDFATVLQFTGFTLVWIAYFRRSARVRNTYGANL